ncbi:MAG: phosphotransferase family protein [Solirubrobacterales bacterium]
MAASAEPELEGGVRSVLSELGVAGAEQASLKEIPGGASRQTFSIEAGEGRFVLRRDPPGAESLVSQAGEFRLIGLAGEAGVPVPEPLALERAGGRFGTAGMLLSFVAGESVGPRVLRSEELEGARAGLAAQLGEAAARIHSIDVADSGLPLAEGDAVLAQIEHWEAEVARIGEPLPVLELGLRWLRLHRPEAVEPRVLHGDFRLGNLIVDERGLAAVIDWELAHTGDPAEDLGWLCIRSWRFGRDEHPVAGVGSREQLLDAYGAAGGERPDARRLRYWELFGNLKWAIICARQAADHRSGLRRSHELASLGRRICEPEWDLLRLIAEPA